MKKIENGIKLFIKLKEMDKNIELSNSYLSRVLGIKEDVFSDISMFKMGKSREMYN